MQIDAIKKDSARVVRENNSLHAQLIQHAEASNAQQTAHYHKVKELESEIAELSFWKHQAMGRLEQSEKCTSELKERLADHLNMGTMIHDGLANVRADVGHLAELPSRLV